MPQSRGFVSVPVLVSLSQGRCPGRRCRWVSEPWCAREHCEEVAFVCVTFKLCGPSG